ncbi:MAG TPA: hypothetical protein PKD64_19520, partial [Pirellulaceae bacterium]|nr:hypothetical protein [Pirellulaceae bacterium]
MLSGVGGLDGAFVATRQGTDVDGSGRDHGAAGDERGVLGSANEETAGQVAGPVNISVSAVSSGTYLSY